MPELKSIIPAIAIRHVSKRFSGVVALDDVSIDIMTGELHAICGENGAGKSTLMKILAGVITQYEGELRIRGMPRHFRDTRQAEEAGISIIHQELNLVDQLSAAANIFLGREMSGRGGWIHNRRMEQAAQQLLDELECPIDPRQPAGELRVGDQQLIEIAKALSLRSEILIMDEPTSALTEAEVERLFRVIGRLRKRGVTILYISHKMDEVFRLADRITVLRDGQLVKTLPRHETTRTEITHLMVGREIESVHFPEPRQPGDVVLEVQGLSRAWPGHARQWRLRDIHFQLHRGEVLGIAGLMGAGRTELLECLFGAATDPLEGRILLNGSLVLFRHPAEALAAGIGLVGEDRKRLGLFAQLSVRDNINVCTLHHTTTVGLLSGPRQRRQAEQSVERLAIKTAGVEAPITSLSGGNQQKCILGRWLLTNPDVLLLDDPTRGVDVGAKAELYRLMDQLCRQGLGIILTSSELPELLAVCDRILVLSEGRQTAEFRRNEATEQKIMEAATARVGGA
ncbi:MAG: sugar ABC transporter ATP-binding protein [Pirellulaceae bacterium]|nr:sugar ABC transporter ATP-binding protein [Pirellulaceae bacterium]